MLQKHCIRCGKCVEVCPADAIYPARRRLGRGRGHAGHRRAQAAVRPVHRPPVHARLPVGRAAAGLRQQRRADGHRGARRRTLRHVPRPGVRPSARSTCPMPGAIVLDDRRPSCASTSEQCVGCGLCEHVCPTEPTSIRVRAAGHDASTVVDALSSAVPVRAATASTRSPSTSARQGIEAMFRFDDALRGWGYQPIYELGRRRALPRGAARRPIPSYRGIAVRDDACVYRRLVGFAVHELIHALDGDATQANYGIPFGAALRRAARRSPTGDEAAYLASVQRRRGARLGRRRAAGRSALRHRLGASTPRATSAPTASPAATPSSTAPPRLPPGAALGSRSTIRALLRAARARSKTTSAPTSPTTSCADCVTRFDAAEARGRKPAQGRRARRRRAGAHPAALPGRNDPCLCGSGKKYKKCCAARYGAASATATTPSTNRRQRTARCPSSGSRRRSWRRSRRPCAAIALIRSRWCLRTVAGGGLNCAKNGA